MWHEVRKQERKIRCLIVDYKRRAERRKDYYERIKADPTQFLQVHGRPCKIHLDPTTVAAGDSSVVMMNWAASPDVSIDRFDVRAHLDCIPESKGSDSEDEQLSYDERYVNYERYRILVQNDFIGVSEEKFLHQLHLEEQFGASTRTGFVPPPIEGKKKVPGAAIGYNYDETPSSSNNQGCSVSDIALPPLPPGSEDSEAIPLQQDSNNDDPDADDEDEDDDSDLDFDVCVDVNQVSTQQAHELNNCSLGYGMEGNDFFSFLTKDKEEADNLRIAKEIEEEKSMFSGRKSRRERRLYREKQLAGRKISPPSYASRRSPTYNDYKDQLRCNTRSRSPSPDNSGRITYITSFGDEEQIAAEASKSAVDSVSNNDKNAAGSLRKSPSSSSIPHSRGKNSYDSSSRSPNRYAEKTGSPNHSHRSPERRSRRISRSPVRYKRHSPVRKYSRSPGRYRKRSRSPGRLGRYSSRDKYSPGDKRSSRDRHFSRDRHNSSRDSFPSSRDRYSSSKDKYSPIRNRSRRTPSPPPAPMYSPKARPTPNNKPVFGVTRSEPTSSQSSQLSSSVPRYYGRRKEKSSSSELSWSESEDTSNSVTNSEKLGSSDIGNASGRTKQAVQCGSVNMGMRERLKRKMQIMLHRQFKADKKAEKEKQVRVEQERIDREDEMREMSIKLRKRERQKRHEYYAELERLERRSRSRTRSKSRSWRGSSSSSSSSNRSRYRRRRKRSKSRSPSVSRSRLSSRSSSGDRKKKSPPKGLVDY